MPREQTAMLIATPISHLFDNQDAARKISACSDCLECRDGSADSELPRQYVFHCDVQPIHEMHADQWRYLHTVVSRKPELRLVSFHAASSYSSPQLQGGIFQPGGVAYSRERMLRYARENIARIKDLFGPGVQVALENNNYYPTDAYRHITDADFLREVIEDNDVYFLFDVAHARITAHNRHMEYAAYRQSLPLDRVVQVHLSGHAVGRQHARDAHNPPPEDVWTEVRELWRAWPRCRFLTVEYYRDTATLVTLLQKSRECIDELSGTTV